MLSIAGVDGSRSIVVISTSLFASLTLLASATVTFVSAAVIALSAVAIGVAPATVTVTFAGADTEPSASETVYGSTATPSNAGTGSKVSAPVESTLHTPSAVVSVLSIAGVEGSRSIVVMSRSLSASLTLSARLTLAIVSLATLAESAVATGATVGTSR